MENLLSVGFSQLEQLGYLPGILGALVIFWLVYEAVWRKNEKIRALLMSNLPVLLIVFLMFLYFVPAGQALAPAVKWLSGLFAWFAVAIGVSAVLTYFLKR
jgi:heme/copper-type cytochrome/quinol oxidase subunit 4